MGSIGKFYPYGVERPSATANDTEKFTGYFRDASTGLDYADQCYEQPGMGRFMTPDPYGGSAKAGDPGSWNKYAYVGGDPVNRVDPNGLDNCDPGDPLPCSINVGDDWWNPLPFPAQYAAWSDPNYAMNIFDGIMDWFTSSDAGQALMKLPRAEELARQALKIDSCNNLLKGSGDLDPTKVLNGLTTGWSGYWTGYGTISFSSDVSAVGSTDGNFWSYGWYPTTEGVLHTAPFQSL